MKYWKQYTKQRNSDTIFRCNERNETICKGTWIWSNCEAHFCRDTLYISNLYKGPATAEFWFLLMWKLGIGVLYAELLNDDTYTFLFDNPFIIDPNVTEDSFDNIDSEQHDREQGKNSIESQHSKRYIANIRRPRKFPISRHE